MGAHELAGHPLGTRTVTYDERDAILYALAVGARADELDLVYEGRLRVLPTFALPLGLWGADALGALGAFEVPRSVHASQTLDVHAPLPSSASLDLTARVGDVWDKGSAAIFEIVVECAYFAATYTVFAPGAGGFGGERGTRRPEEPEPVGEPVQTRVETFPEQAALYRLTGDRHLIHILPEAAHGIGQPRPIMHGLCTLGASVLGVARATGNHPAELRLLTGRFSAPVLPGQTLDIRADPVGEARSFATQVTVDDNPVITGATLSFAEPRGEA